ncbi:MAG: polysaccharide biosynthesis tyrosine autokinase [Planctomycetota bacterium]|nr:MAG: polysaccharide biosynthesis tyrosine autokinase [Planctomycetota bacterium]
MTTVSGTVQERIMLPPSAREGEADSASALTARDVWTMFRRRLVLIVVLFVLFTGMAVGGFLLWWFKFPGYRSEALIACISNIPRAELTPEQARLRQDEYERFVLTQAALLKSPGILSEALKVTAVRETQWWKDIEKRRWKRPNEHLIELMDELNAGPVRGTNFLKVSMVCRNPKDPAVIVRAVVNQWYDTVKQRTASEFADSALTAARQELDELDREIEDKRHRLQELATRLPPGARTNPENNVVSQRVQQLSQQVTQLQLELAELEQFRDFYNDPSGLAATAEDRAWVEQDPEVAGLRQGLFLLRQQRAADERVYGPGHRILKQLDAEIAAREKELEQLRMQKLEERRQDAREAANTAYENTLHALYLAQENLAKAEAALQDQDRLLLENSNLETDIEQSLEYRKQLVEYIKGLERVKAQRTAIDVHIAQEPTDPLERYSPNPLLLVAGILLSIALSVSIGLGLELVDTSVRTSQDVVRHLNVALLGLVPDTDDEEIPIQRVERAVRDAPHSMVAEAFRGIRTAVQFAAPAERQRLMLVTSPRPEDGKTTVACNLATALAQGGRRVLLIDANIRRPGVHKVFPGREPKGLSNLLIGDGTLAQLAYTTDVDRLDVLPSGPASPNPAELLAGEAFHALLREARDQYDQVLIDCAPVLLASDPLVIGPIVDGVILVVRAKQNSRGIARRALTLLGDVGSHVFGVVLNAAQVARGGYFREQLRAYYEYQEGADTSHRLP